MEQPPYHSPLQRPPRLVPLVFSLLLHAGLAALLLVLPARGEEQRSRPIEITERKLPPLKPKPPDPPEPKDEPEPEPEPPPKAVVKPRRLAMRSKRNPPDQPPSKAPPPDKAPEPAPNTGPKTFGIKLEGTTTAPPGTGVQVPRGDTLRTDPRIRKRGPRRPKRKKPKGFKKKWAKGERAPTAVITRMPKVRKRVTARYPERMRELGIEGRVVLQLTIDEQGKVVKVRVLTSLRRELDRKSVV